MGHLKDFFSPKKTFKNILPTALTLLTLALLSSSQPVDSDCDSCHVHHYLRTKIGPDQKRFSTRFWEFSSESDTWVAVKFPFHGDLGETDGPDQTDSPEKEKPATSYPGLGVRKRMSLTEMTDGSIWVSGESGMIYERFWNGLQWVIAPHALPVYAVSVFFVGQRILALSEAGRLYQIQLNQESQPMWAELSMSEEAIQLSSGVLANNKERMYFCTKNGLLLELLEIDPLRWKYHGRPSGANVSAIADVDTFRPGLLFIVSSSGDLYEYDQTSKPPWKKHIRQQAESEKDNSTALAASQACSLHGLVGPHSSSLFLLTKGGELIERRLHQRKWKWVVHGNPKGHVLSSITCISQDEPNDQNPNTLFFTTAAGFVFQYRIQNHPGISKDQEIEEKWLNHNHPLHARAARGISGLQLQPGRIIFPLDDGRLAELHLLGHGGERLGPNTPLSTRRKPSLKYNWSILDAPESEGWNAEYCTEQRGPTNCISGTKDESTETILFSRRKTQESYLIPRREKDTESSPKYKRVDRLFRLRSMHEGRSFFLISDEGLTFECMNNGNTWFWLNHEHSTRVKGVVGKYNGSLFVVDEDGSLHMRERRLGELSWVNFTSMRRGKAVIGGPPWDSKKSMAHPEDSLFFVTRNGKLMRINVVQRKFKWKDCKNPPGVKIASIVDQEGFRENVVFVVGVNGRLYQYNKVSGLWHEHYQSNHLVLSRSVGTAMRGGSLFLLSEEGGLVEYQWGGGGWNWVEHGQARTNVRLVGAPGPCLGGVELFLTGSDGNVYRRYLDGGEWKWEDRGFPGRDDDGQMAEEVRETDRNCNPKVSSTRPIAFSEKSVIFELQDGRMAELSRTEHGSWFWSRAIVAPTSLCMKNHWST